MFFRAVFPGAQSLFFEDNGMVYDAGGNYVTDQEYYDMSLGELLSQAESIDLVDPPILVGKRISADDFKGKLSKTYVKNLYNINEITTNWVKNSKISDNSVLKAEIRNFISRFSEETRFISRKLSVYRPIAKYNKLEMEYAYDPSSNLPHFTEQEIENIFIMQILPMVQILSEHKGGVSIQKILLLDGPLEPGNIGRYDLVLNRMTINLQSLRYLNEHYPKVTLNFLFQHEIEHGRSTNPTFWAKDYKNPDILKDSIVEIVDHMYNLREEYGTDYFEALSEFVRAQFEETWIWKDSNKALSLADISNLIFYQTIEIDNEILNKIYEDYVYDKLTDYGKTVVDRFIHMIKEFVHKDTLVFDESFTFNEIQNIILLELKDWIGNEGSKIIDDYMLVLESFYQGSNVIIPSEIW